MGMEMLFMGVFAAGCGGVAVVAATGLRNARPRPPEAEPPSVPGREYHVVRTESVLAFILSAAMAIGAYTTFG